MMFARLHGPFESKQSPMAPITVGERAIFNGCRSLAAKLGAAAAIGLVGMFAHAPAAKAGVIQFVMADVTFVDGTGSTDTVTGGFLWDTSTQDAIISTITVSGSSEAAINGVYSILQGSSGAQSLYLQNSAVNIYVMLNFQANLSTTALGQSDSYASGFLRDNTSGGVGYNVVGNVTGSADAIPEPASIALFATAGAALWTMRRRRRAV